MKCKPVCIVGAGICCLDHIIVSPQVAWGNTTTVLNYCVQGGGLVATALVACSRLGAKTKLISLLGKDSIAEPIIDELHREGVSTNHVFLVPGGTSPFSFIHVDAANGERTIFHRRATGLICPENNWDEMARADVLVVDGYYPELAREAIAAAQRHQVPILADATPSDENREWLEKVNILIAPYHYVREGHFGSDPERALAAALDAIHAIGPATAVITLGEAGWIASDATGRVRGSAFPVRVIDTLGAGDVFHGAFAFGIAQGWNTARTAEFASAVAALKCTAVGGRTGIPTLEQTNAFLNQHLSAH